MKKYECVIIVKPNISERQLTETIDRLTKKINEVGKTTEIKKMGKKKLAYEVKCFKEGYYIAYMFESSKSRENSTKVIETFIKTREEIIRYIIVGA